MLGLELSASLESSYAVKLSPGLLSGRNGDLGAAVAGRQALFLTTPSVFRHHGRALLEHVERSSIRGTIEVLELSEQAKHVGSVLQVCGLAQALELDRHAVLVAFGGGVCSDVVSFAASMIRRGLSHVRIPTTLVGQVDAGVGLKGGVNFRGGKNFLGCFHPPGAVLVDPAFLRTLPHHEIRQGLAEIVKISLIRDAGLFRLLERVGERLSESGFADPSAEGRLVISRSIALMLDELRSNPYENRSLARRVDMGHTFSPQIESASGFAMPHGDAVAIDIALTCRVATNLGLFGHEDAVRVLRLLARFGLPTDSVLLDLALCRAAIRSAVLHRGGNLNLVLPVAIGRAGFIREPGGLPESVLLRSIDQLRSVGAEDDVPARPGRERPMATAEALA
jgi:2-epi-5-epi-valiolone synthase